MKILPSEKAFRLPSFSDWNVLICSFHFYISMSSPILSDTLRCSSFKILFSFSKVTTQEKKRLFILPLGKWACSKCNMHSQPAIECWPSAPGLALNKSDTFHYAFFSSPHHRALNVPRKWRLTGTAVIGWQPAANSVLFHVFISNSALLSW